MADARRRRPGDEMWVSGTIGGRRGGTGDAAASGEPGSADSTAARSRLRREASAAGAAGATGRRDGRARAARAAMDLSDGLADALRQVAAASGCGVRIDGERVADRSGRARVVDGRGRRSGERGGRAAATTTSCCSRCRRESGGALRSVARHVADPPLTKIGVFTKDPRELVLERDGERGRVTGRVRTLCASLSPTGRKRSRRWLSPRYSCFCTRPRRATRAPRRARRPSPRRRCCRRPARGCSSPPRPIARARRPRRASACGPASRPPIRRCCPSAPWSALETPNPRYSGIWTVMDTGPAVQGRIVDLYLWSCKEALAVRPPAGAPDRAAPRLEPAEQHSRHGRHAVPQARGRVEEAAAACADAAPPDADASALAPAASPDTR